MRQERVFLAIALAHFTYSILMQDTLEHVVYQFFG